MSETLSKIQALVQKRAIRVSDHAFKEMEQDDILPSEILDGVKSAVVVEDYPEANRGPSVLVLCHDRLRRPLHAVWGISNNLPGIAFVITAYRPLAELWSADFLKRLKP